MDTGSVSSSFRAGHRTGFVALAATIACSLSSSGCGGPSEPPPSSVPPPASLSSGGLESAGALEFGDDGVLFVGDSLGSRVVAFETADTTPPQDSTAGGVYVEEIDVELAGLLGASPRDVVINDLAVNPISQNVYLSVHVGRSVDPRAAVVRYGKDSAELEVLDLDAMPHTQAELPGAPGFEDTLQYGQSIRTLTITDLTWYDGELFVAGVSNQEFDSTLRRLSYPFTGEHSRSTVEIYHASHDQYETHAPIVTSIVYEGDGGPYLIAAYTCTPLARFRLADLQDGAHVVGDTIAELGYGNDPVDMLVYRAPPQLGGGERILITNDQRGAVSVGTGAVLAAEPLTTQATGPTGLDQAPAPVTGALHAAVLNGRYSVVVRRNVQSGDWSLMTLNNGSFFEVAESVAEYNFPNVPDSDTEATNPIRYRPME